VFDCGSPLAGEGIGGKVIIVDVGSFFSC
jgi:hypothetical protein